MTLIQTSTLVSSADGIEFTSIPQDGTDLYVLVSIRAATSGQFDNMELTINGTGSSFTKRALYGTGNSVSSFAGSDGQIGYTSANSAAANTFGNASIYIPNYAGNLNKGISTDAVSEDNATSTVIQSIFANLWSSTAAITSLRVRTNGASMAAGSSISLYKITKGSDGTTVVS
jgi:hypothetical protein